MAKATKRRSIGLSVDKGQFVKAVGYSRSRLGNISARRWYLGAVDDGEDAAIGRFIKIRQAWAEGPGGRNSREQWQVGTGLGRQR
jgi:hypothetical protein